MSEEWPTTGLDIPLGWQAVPFRQFILKLHSRCNLACDYCYMYQLADQTWSSRPRIMAPDVVTRTCARIAEHVARHRLARIEVVLHGGEPLLAGPAMLTGVATELRRVLPPSTTADLLLQTNGVLLNELALDAFSTHGIRVGVSVDGTPDTHDRHRRYRDGRGSYAAVKQALQLLNGDAYRRLFAGLLCVVDVAADPTETYESLIAFQPPRVDFLLPHGNWSTQPPHRSANGNKTPYGDWLVAAFERWYGAPRQETEVRLFTEIINLVLGGPSRSEGVGLSPVALITVDTDGSIEQVDTLRSVYHGASATTLNVVDNSFDDALHHPSVVARQIGVAALGETCQRCGIRDVCGGGNFPHRYRRGTGFRNASVYCPDLTKLITHIADRVKTDLAALVR